ncbi:hypothetical protein [Allorhizocola rhizosphaerae]|uniref:hypothetical protein n=1 Tax=Allorhizocola rhizosphaerae TaxID=1872709 RepID=UPI003CCC5513
MLVLRYWEQLSEAEPLPKRSDARSVPSSPIPHVGWLACVTSRLLGRWKTHGGGCRRGRGGGRGHGGRYGRRAWTGHRWVRGRERGFAEPAAPRRDRSQREHQLQAGDECCGGEERRQGHRTPIRVHHRQCLRSGDGHWLRTLGRRRDRCTPDQRCQIQQESGEQQPVPAIHGPV